MKRTLGEKIFDVFNVVLLFCLGLTFLYPFWNTLVLSFNDSLDSMRGGVHFWPRIFTLDNYKVVLNDVTIYRAYIITILKTVLGTASGLILTGMFAYGLSKKKLMFRNVYLTICTGTLFFSGGLVPTYLLYRSLGLLDSFMVYIIPGLWQVATMLIMKSFFIGLPDALEEAAEIDGCNHVQIFFKIIVPLSTPVIATIALTNGVAHWNGWFDAYIYINDESLYPLQTVLMKIINQSNMITAMKSGEMFQAQTDVAVSSGVVTSEGIKMATMMVTIGPIILAYPFLQKYFVKGMTIGSVKE